jgi:hypothetical protein
LSSSHSPDRNKEAPRIPLMNLLFDRTRDLSAKDLVDHVNRKYLERVKEEPGLELPNASQNRAIASYATQTQHERSDSPPIIITAPDVIDFDFLGVGQVCKSASTSRPASAWISLLVLNNRFNDTRSRNGTKRTGCFAKTSVAVAVNGSLRAAGRCFLLDTLSVSLSSPVVAARFLSSILSFISMGGRRIRSLRRHLLSRRFLELSHHPLVLGSRFGFWLLELKSSWFMSKLTMSQENGNCGMLTTRYKGIRVANLPIRPILLKLKTIRS